MRHLQLSMGTLPISDTLTGRFAVLEPNVVTSRSGYFSIKNPKFYAHRQKQFLVMLYITLTQSIYNIMILHFRGKVETAPIDFDKKLAISA